MSTEGIETGFRERVEAVVAQIPLGRVMTYGQLAALCGNARAARIVGGIAHFGDPALPWQRVVNKKGGLAAGYPGERAAHAEHLRAEGVTVSADYHVDVTRLIWWPEESGVGRKALAVNGGHDNLIPPASYPMVVIVGETASGKSALAMEIASRFGGEIVCADAWSVYRGMDIGTAKPSARDRLAVRHHVLDVAEITTGFSAALFQQYAQGAIDEIKRRQKIPVLAGGSGLYVDSVVYNYGFNTSPNRLERDVLNTMSLAELQTLAHKRKIDTSQTDMNNKRRVIRLIENNGRLAKRSSLPLGVCIVGVMTTREQLHAQVVRRVDAMLQKGLQAEATSLAEQYGWENEAMKGIGYREWQPFVAGECGVMEVREAIVRSTMQLAKKQRTWFRRNADIVWFVSANEAVAYVSDWLRTYEKKQCQMVPRGS